jgi:hypothetical protein
LDEIYTTPAGGEATAGPKAGKKMVARVVFTTRTGFTLP